LAWFASKVFDGWFETVRKVGMILMSAQAPGNEQPTANDSEWLEFPDRFEVSAASVWALDYEEEITIQSKLVAATPEQQETANTGGEPIDDEARPRARTLDESRLLPSEASFATVKLYQQYEAPGVNRYEQPATGPIDVTTENRDNSRTRRLDISHVLPGEVSYATVRLQIGNRPHSPIREFFAASNLDWRKLVVEALLLISVSSAIAIVALKLVKPNVFSPNGTESNSAVISQPQPEPTLIPTELGTSDAEAAAAESNDILLSNDTPSTPENAARVEAAVEVVPEKSNVALNSEESKKPAADEIKSQLSTKTPQQEGKSRTRNPVSTVEGSKPALTTQQLPPSAKKVEAGPLTERIGVSNRPGQIVAARVQSSSSTNAISAQPKAAPTSAPVTGGGQRPRTVTPKTTP
jgi:hypothetical protein